MLSIGGRPVHINSVMSNMVMYMFFVFLLPKGALNRLDLFRSKFFWQGDKKNIDWLNRVLFIVPKTKEGSVFMTLRSKYNPPR
jgi:hypothetical protein